MKQAPTLDPASWKNVTFRECGVHQGLLFACERCPVCVIIEDRDLALGRADEEKTQLEGRIADLEQQISTANL